MPKSIKKKFASHIYYGMLKGTDNLRYIDDVASGKKCECTCVNCGRPLEAKKGKKRRHHFAHVSNYECMYAGEVSVYKAFAKTLENEAQIKLPAAYLQFRSWSKRELVRESRDISIDSVIFTCEEKEYPPVLKVMHKHHELRILLNFNSYYTEKDEKDLADEAKWNVCSLLMYHLPEVDSTVAFGPERIRTIINTADKAQWCHSEKVEDNKQKFRVKATEQPEYNGGHLCPISKHYFGGKYYAFRSDCACCEYNVAEDQRCICTAATGIRSMKDFSRSEEELLAEVAEERRKNEQYLQTQMSIEDLQLLAKINQHPKSMESAQRVPSYLEKEEAFREILKSFDPEGTTPTRDKLGRRWIKCTWCGRIKQSEEFVMYDNRVPNLGMCSVCARGDRG